MINLGGINDNNIYSGISVGEIFPEIKPVAELYDYNHPARPIFLELTKKYPPLQGEKSIIRLYKLKYFFFYRIKIFSLNIFLILL